MEREVNSKKQEKLNHLNWALILLHLFTHSTKPHQIRTQPFIVNKAKKSHLEMHLLSKSKNETQMHKLNTHKHLNSVSLFIICMQSESESTLAAWNCNLNTTLTLFFSLLHRADLNIFPILPSIPHYSLTYHRRSSSWKLTGAPASTAGKITIQSNTTTATAIPKA